MTLVLFLYIFDWRMMCDVRVRCHRSMPERGDDERAMAQRSRTFVLGIFFITFRNEVFVGRRFVSSCICANGTHPPLCSTGSAGPCDLCFTAFIIGKILCVLQTTHHAPHTTHDTYAARLSFSRARPHARSTINMEFSSTFYFFSWVASKILPAVPWPGIALKTLAARQPNAFNKL